MNYQERFYEISNKYKYIGINTLLIKNNKVYTSCQGVKTLGESELLDKDTIFRIASVSKIIVALGIMKLYEQGKIKITEDISTYLGYKVRNPYYKDIPITLEMLMTQTSSISDGNDEVKGYDGVNGSSAYVKLEDLLVNTNSEYYLDRTFNNVLPGSTWEYSNFGCGILACIIEKVSGVYFSDYIRQEILLPLGLDSSFKASDIIKKDKIASLYEYDKENDKFDLTRNKDMFLKYEYRKFPLGDNYRMAAGGLFISLNDLSIIGSMLSNYGTYKGIHIFNKSTIEYMKEVHWQGTSPDPDYYKKGLQLQILDHYSKKPIYGHFGSAYGQRSFMFFNDEVVMVFITNGADVKDNPERGISDLQHETIELMLGYTDYDQE